MKKWGLSAIIYLGIVIAGYAAYDSFFAEKETAASHKEEHTAAKGTVEDQDSHNNESHAHPEGAQSKNEVNVQVMEADNQMYITLQDNEGNPVRDLEINHEKLLHLIVVDEHLENFYHLHPEEIEPGKFKVKTKLEEGVYKAFVDIKPENLAYQVEAKTFTVGNAAKSTHSHASLVVDKDLVKTIDGQKASLSTTDLAVNQPITLTFDVHGAKLTPYLGAMGHVVILDEEAKEYIHVHPSDDNAPVFETEFSHPGLYKIWAQFQKDGKILTFPYVIEVK